MLQKRVFYFSLNDDLVARCLYFRHLSSPVFPLKSKGETSDIYITSWVVNLDVDFGSFTHVVKVLFKNDICLKIWPKAATASSNIFVKRPYLLDWIRVLWHSLRHEDGVWATKRRYVPFFVLPVLIMNWSDLCAQLVRYAKLTFFMVIGGQIHAGIELLRQLYLERVWKRAWPRWAIRVVLQALHKLNYFPLSPVIRIVVPAKTFMIHPLITCLLVFFYEEGSFVPIEPNGQIDCFETGLSQMHIHLTLYDLACLINRLAAHELDRDRASLIFRIFFLARFLGTHLQALSKIKYYLYLIQKLKS